MNLKYKCKSLLIQSNLGTSTDKFTLYTSSTFTKLIKKRNVSVSTYLWDYAGMCPTPHDCFVLLIGIIERCSSYRTLFNVEH